MVKSHEKTLKDLLTSLTYILDKLLPQISADKLRKNTEKAVFELQITLGRFKFPKSLQNICEFQPNFLLSHHCQYSSIR